MPREASAVDAELDGNQVPALLNSQRPTTPGYYHSYNKPAGGNRTLHQVGTINNTFTNNLGTY